ncbi:LytTR family transcriptional regulator DNA-binding domain-containing protein [Olivibacter sp. SDN3]|uniref:LytR/AlgR family response regulator transcription factor n=1 Tax=Olivibacter sp. SDN3 TaxID=2764720 RepID=UPI00165169F6|nr:LytTR family transcriptional regulator DNA-binding domain-containing protein [Olivibacter sp. SDN3]QNL50629.1 LytTR family transcriptional regulator DNA-binding domain-containing protein [Olivibacter sp. SDN3]
MTSLPSISCLLLEDDYASGAMVKSILTEFFPNMTLFVCTNIDEARRIYKTHLPTLLVLDINLPDGTSFDWLRELYIQEQQKFSVIFTTAYATYAVEAFKFSALDFLLKPIMPNDLINAVSKAMKIIKDQNYKIQLETFFHNFQVHNTIDKKIVLKTVEEISVVSIQDILAVEADNSYSKFHLQGGKSILVSQSLKTYDQQLSASGFMRIHQSYLVQACYIKSFKKKNNLLLLEGGLLVPVSLNKRSFVMDYLTNL